MSTEDEFKAHGLLGSLDKADWPPLTFEEANRVLAHYPQARGARRLLSQSPRPFSAGSVIESRLGEVFLKRHALSVRDGAALIEEHRFIDYLADREALVRPVLRNDDDETALVLGDWIYEVHPVARGEDVYKDALSWTPFLNADHGYEAGQAMARLHLAASGYDAPRREVKQLASSFTIFAEDAGTADPVAGMHRYLEHRPLLRKYAEERDWHRSFNDLLLPLFAELSPWLVSMSSLWTHNDFHASNLMWSDAGRNAQVKSVIDFGLADRTTAVHDLATAIERNIVEWLSMGGEDMIHFEQLDSLLSGYDELCPLSYEEAFGLAAMLPLVHCEFALSETDYFLSILNSKEKAYLAYEGYFLAHAEWFKSDQGQRLLDHLKGWAAGIQRKTAIGVK